MPQKKTFFLEQLSCFNNNHDQALAIIPAWWRRVESRHLEAKNSQNYTFFLSLFLPPSLALGKP